VYPTDNFTRKRFEIMKRAAAGFHQRGYHGSSVRSIAQASGMVKSKFFIYYFKDKQLLYFYHDDYMDCLLELLKRVERDNSAPAERLHALIESFVRLLIDELALHAGMMFKMTMTALSPSQYRKIRASTMS